MTIPYLSVILPAYNEGERITTTLLRLQQYLSTIPYDYEVLVVNDGSSDNTADVVTEFARSFPQLSLIDCMPNAGKGTAVYRGMIAAKGQYHLFMDADNSVDISELPRFTREHEENGADVVIGSIALGGEVVEHNGIHRRLFGSLSKLLIRGIATPGIYDTQRGFKLFTAIASHAIFPKQTVARYGFDIELLVIAREQGFTISEPSVAWDNPAGSKVSLGDYGRTFAELGKIVWNRVLGRYSRTAWSMNHLRDEYDHHIVSA